MLFVHFQYIESEKDNNTSVLLRQYDRKPNASFNELYKFLEDMNRRDCLEILDNAKTGKKYIYIM